MQTDDLSITRVSTGTLPIEEQPLPCSALSVTLGIRYISNGVRNVSDGVRKVLGRCQEGVRLLQEGFRCWQEGVILCQIVSGDLS